MFVFRSNHLQLLIAIQLMIFLNHIGHYGNAVILQDISEWVGVSVGSVQSCTDRAMVAILEQHNKFVYIPGEGSEDMELA